MDRNINLSTIKLNTINDFNQFYFVRFLNKFVFYFVYFKDSTIIDFYPEDFKIDLNGKKFAWQGVALLPFVDEKRLFKALIPLHSKLTDEEG